MSDTLTLKNRLESSLTLENVTLSFLFNQVTNSQYTDELDNLQLHTHKYAEMFVCFSGSVTIITQSGHIILTGGDIMIVPVGYHHKKLLCTDDTVWCSVGIQAIRRHQASSADLYRIFSDICHAEYPIILHDRRELCGTYLTVINNDSDDSINRDIQTALILYQFHGHAVACGQPEGNKLREKVDIKRTAQLEYLIEIRYADDFAAEDIARELYISPSQLQRICKKHFGTTFHRALRKKRIMTASIKLRETDTSIDDIALLVGYQTRSCFYRAFKEEMCMTPNEYRALNSAAEYDTACGK